MLTVMNFAISNILTLSDFFQCTHTYTKTKNSASAITIQLMRILFVFKKSPAKHAANNVQLAHCMKIGRNPLIADVINFAITLSISY